MDGRRGSGSSLAGRTRVRRRVVAGQPRRCRPGTEFAAAATRPAAGVGGGCGVPSARRGRGGALRAGAEPRAGRRTEVPQPGRRPRCQPAAGVDGHGAAAASRRAGDLRGDSRRAHRRPGRLPGGRRVGIARTGRRSGAAAGDAGPTRPQPAGGDHRQRRRRSSVGQPARGVAHRPRAPAHGGRTADPRRRPQRRGLDATRRGPRRSRRQRPARRDGRATSVLARAGSASGSTCGDPAASPADIRRARPRSSRSSNPPRHRRGANARRQTR